MVNTKLFNVIVLSLCVNISSAQYCTIKEDSAIINHYACLMKNERVNVYQYQAPMDLSSYFYNEIIGYDIQKDSISLSIMSTTDKTYSYRLVLKSELNMDSICICDNQVQLNGDSFFLALYQPIEDIEVYHVSHIIERTGRNAMFPLKPSVYTRFRKKALTQCPVLKAKCTWNCKLPLKDNSTYIYITHKDYHVSELIKISVLNDGMRKTRDEK